MKWPFCLRHRDIGYSFQDIIETPRDKDHGKTPDLQGQRTKSPSGISQFEKKLLFFPNT